MPPLPSTLVLLAFIGTNLVLIWIALQVALRLEWNALAESFPARDPGAGAVRRRFQSIAIGGANFGMCVQIAVDESRLHIRPGALLRVCGARGMSIPWSEVSLGERRKFFGAEQVQAAIGNSVLTGPAWCLEPARPARRRP